MNAISNITVLSMMYRTIILCLVISLATLINAQSDEEVANLIKKVSTIRSELLTFHAEDLEGLKSILGEWEYVGADDAQRKDLLINLTMHLGKGKTVKEIVNQMRDYGFPGVLYRNLDSVEVKCLERCLPVLRFISLDLFDFEYPFKIKRESRLFDELNFYNLTNENTIGEVAVGDGSFALMCAMLFPDLKLFLNEASEYNLNTAESMFTSYRNYVELTNVHFELGSEISTNYKKSSLDKIIVRNSYHHFSHKSDMLKSIRKALKKGGELLLLEGVKNVWKLKGGVRCPHILPTRTIINKVEANGFRLKEKKKMYDNTYVLPALYACLDFTQNLANSSSYFFAILFYSIINNCESIFFVIPCNEPCV